MQMLQQAWKNPQDKKKKQLGAAKRYVLPNAFKSQLYETLLKIMS